mgnify:CR=1 FL=1
MLAFQIVLFIFAVGTLLIGFTVENDAMMHKRYGLNDQGLSKAGILYCLLAFGYVLWCVISLIIYWIG